MKVTNQECEAFQFIFRKKPHTGNGVSIRKATTYKKGSIQEYCAGCGEYVKDISIKKAEIADNGNGSFAVTGGLYDNLTSETTAVSMKQGTDYTVIEENGMYTIHFTDTNPYYEGDYYTGVQVQGVSPVPAPSVTDPTVTPGNPSNPAVAPTIPSVPKKNVPAKTKVSSVKNSTNGQAVVTVKGVKNASRYEVQISTNKKFKSGVKKKTTTRMTVTFKGLKKGKTYYVRVRAVNASGKGAWSAVKKVKVKK